MQTDQYLTYAPNVRRLELRSRRALKADVLGSYRSAFRGSGLVYADLRPYQPGDEVKNIHWKVTARSKEVYVKSYEEERMLNVLLALDISRSTNFGKSRTKHEKIFDFAALVAMLAQRGGDALGLCLFSDMVEEFAAPKRSLHQFHKIMFRLLSHKNLHQATDLKPALVHIQRHLKRPSIIFVVSDFYAAPCQDELARLCFKHDVICVLVQDDLDREIPALGLIEFQDAETGELYLFDSSSSNLRKMLHSLQVQREEALRKMCSKAGADLIFINQSPLTPLAELMRRRSVRAQHGTQPLRHS